MAKLAAITKPPKSKRHKIFCQSCGGDDVLPSAEFRATECDGMLELECTVCRADVALWYTPQAVEAMVKAAVDAHGE